MTIPTDDATGLAADRPWRMVRETAADLDAMADRLYAQLRQVEACYRKLRRAADDALRRPTPPAPAADDAELVSRLDEIIVLAKLAVNYDESTALLIQLRDLRARFAQPPGEKGKA